MRISDWSSDVCSSDLAWPVAYRVGCGAEQQGLDEAALPHHRAGVALVVVGVAAGEAGELAAQRVVVRVVGEVAAIAGEGGAALVRSEEHTSELQSLMRISYAVFCLKKKKKL